MTPYIPTPKQIVDVVCAVLDGNRTAVSFSHDLKQRVRATRKRFKGGKVSAVDIVLTISRPNYQEREFLKLCRKAKCRPKRIWCPGKQA